MLNATMGSQPFLTNVESAMTKIIHLLARTELLQSINLAVSKY
jgi:hypothetical protein